MSPGGRGAFPKFAGRARQHCQASISGLLPFMSPPVAVSAPWLVSASVATLASVAPLWAGSFQVPAPWQAWLLGSSLASRLVFLSLGLFTMNVCFLEALFPSQTVGARCLFCVSSPTKRPAWRPGWFPLDQEEQCLLCSTPTAFLPGPQRAGILALDT